MAYLWEAEQSKWNLSSPYTNCFAAAPKGPIGNWAPSWAQEHVIKDTDTTQKTSVCGEEISYL